MSAQATSLIEAPPTEGAPESPTTSSTTTTALPLGGVADVVPVPAPATDAAVVPTVVDAVAPTTESIEALVDKRVTAELARREQESQAAVPVVQPPAGQEGVFTRAARVDLGYGETLPDGEAGRSAQAQIASYENDLQLLGAWKRNLAQSTTTEGRLKAQQQMQLLDDRLAVTRDRATNTRFHVERTRSSQPASDPQALLADAKTQLASPDLKKDIAARYPLVHQAVEAGRFQLEAVLGELDFSRDDYPEQFGHALARYENNLTLSAPAAPLSAPPGTAPAPALAPAPAPGNPGTGAPGETEGYSTKPGFEMTQQDYDREKARLHAVAQNQPN